MWPVAAASATANSRPFTSSTSGCSVESASVLSFLPHGVKSHRDGLWLVPAGMGLLLLYATVRAVSQPVEVERWLQFAGVAVAAIALGLTPAACSRAGSPARGPDPLEAGAAVAIGSIGAGIYALVTGVIYDALHWAVPLILAP